MGVEREPIAVVGTGYVGLVTAVGFAELGSDVFCVDVDASKVERLRAGEVPIHEPGLEEALAGCRERLRFSTDLDEAIDAARLLFVCVGTPSTYSGDADLSAVRAVVDAVPASDRHALVMKSTVPPGTGASIKRDLAAAGKALAYVSCPEFLREGSALDDFRQPDRIVVGDDRDWAGDAVVALYGAIDAPLVRTDVVSAEMVKLASNAFLSTKISFINEIANVCEETGADVTEVARGMGLDKRIGPSFLKAGIGFGGSCLPGEETVLVRDAGETRLVSLAQLFAELAVSRDRDPLCVELVTPDDLEVLSWRPGESRPEFLPVTTVTRRHFEGELVEVRTKMGRRLRATPDHPFVTSDGSDQLGARLAGELDDQCWLPLAQGCPPVRSPEAPSTDVLEGMNAAGKEDHDVIVRPASSELEKVPALSTDERVRVFASHPRPTTRWHDVRRSGALRLDECRRLGLSVREATVGTARNGTYVPTYIECDEHFWRVVGLYIAEGHCSRDGQRRRLQWSFHPTAEEHLVDEVADFWRGLGVKVSVRRLPTTTAVSLSSRLLAGWWTGVLGLGANCCEQRVPDQIWCQPMPCKRALLSGMWAGDGSWSYVSGGPSVVIEYGTASRELVDATLRLLGDVGIAASLRIGRTALSTCDNYWIRISGTAQVERMLDLLGPDAKEVRQSLRRVGRIAPTGYRRDAGGTAWVRVRAVARARFRGSVYSLEVPGSQTFVSTSGLITHNCFPKDIDALKQLAGNTGYHFQLLGAVIEVNQLQKRRVIAKLRKHLGELVGRRVALLGLAFKPDTDDMREASSLVLAGRLGAEGAEVKAYDPVAADQARELMPGVRLESSALEALDGADAAVLVTEWPEFSELNWSQAAERMAGTLIVDGRNALDPEAVRAAGLTYEGIGRR